MAGMARLAAAEGSKSCPQGRQDREKNGGEPLEVERGRGQVGLDLHVGEAAAHGAGEAVPGLRFAVDAFDPPAMALVKAPVFVGPSLAPAAGAEQRRMVVALLTRPGDRQSGRIGQRAQSRARE
jgi:hypothetical protein